MEAACRASIAQVEDPDIYTERAVLELMRGNKDAATVLFERALRLNPYADDVTEALRRLRATPGDRR